MMERFSRIRGGRQFVVAIATMLALAVTAGMALAGHVGGDVKSYTGCLTTNGGTMSLIKEGDAPQKTCPSGSLPVHFSGGDITKISGGTGIQVTHGDSGEATISVDPRYSLRQDCSSGQVIKWNGTGWGCANDNDTTYTADGTTLTLGSGNVFSIDPDYRVTNDQSCSSGTFATGLDDVGSLTCATPATGGVNAFIARSGTVDLAGETTVISKTLPAGTYLLFASVELVNRDQGFSIGSCSIPGYATENHIVEYEPSFVRGAHSLSLASSVNHSGGAIVLKCTEFEADIDVFDATLTAIKVTSLG